MHRLHFKYDYHYQAAIFENQLRAPELMAGSTPKLMAGSTPNFNHRYIYLLGIFYGFFTRGEHYGPGHFILTGVENTAFSPKNLTMKLWKLALFALI
jgi:hypothetical protein